MDTNKLHEEQDFRKQLEEEDRLKRLKFVQENSAPRKKLEETQEREENNSPNYTESFRHHIVPFSQVIIKSPEVERTHEETLFPFLQPSRGNNTSGGDIELTMFESKDTQKKNAINQLIDLGVTASLGEDISVDEDHQQHNTKIIKKPSRIKAANQDEENTGTIMRVRRSFGMTTKETPYKFVFDDYVHHNVFYIPICITALAGLIFLIIAKLLEGVLIFNIIGIGLLVFTPFWFVVMRTRTVKIDTRTKIIERRTQRCCVKSIDKFNLENVIKAELKYYGDNHMIVLETRNNSIIEISLTADAFNHQLKSETIKQFNSWLEKVQIK